VERIKTRCRLRSFHKSGKKIGTQKWLKNKNIICACIMWDFCVLGFFLFIEGTEMTVYEVRKNVDGKFESMIGMYIFKN